METEFSFGRWIRRRRAGLGLTREALAERVAYSTEMIRKIENDERLPSLKAATLLAQALEIPPEQVETFIQVARHERAVDHLGSPLTSASPGWQAPRPRTNLPIPPTLLVGRQNESARVAELLRDPACRLVSVVGLGGSGKSRLAVQVAQGALAHFAHGVYFVPLAPLAEAALIAPAIAQALQVQFREVVEPQEELLHYLRDKRMLLVLDNFEHLLDGATLAAAILRAAPGVKLLVTSREPLNLRGEWVLELAGLPYPDGEAAERADLEAFEAVQLFLQTALRADPGFDLNAGNRAWVARICRLTEGLPLGIELAAAWVRALSCQAIAQEIETNLDFLKASARDVPERQRSLRATLDHSWQLLSAEEQDGFRRLSVFRGGFAREAAQAVAAAGLDSLTALLNKGLLKRVGDDRYDMHELVRHYAAERLAADPPALAETRARHAHYYAARCEQWGKVITSLDQRAILADMESELENVRLAWEWLVRQGATAEIRRALPGLWYFHEMQGRYQAGADFLRQALEGLQTPAAPVASGEAEREAVLGQLAVRLAYFYGHVGRYEAARVLFEQNLARLRARGDENGLAEALAYYGHMHLRQGLLAEARHYLEAGLQLHRAQGNTVGQVFCLIALSFTALSRQDSEAAYVLSSESLALCREVIDNPYGASNSLVALSTAAANLGRLDEARRWAEEGLALCRRLNNRWGGGQALRRLGVICVQQGEHEAGEALLRQAIAEFREIGDRPFTAWALLDLGQARRAAGAEAEARQCLTEAMALAEATQTHIVVRRVREALAAYPALKDRDRLARRPEGGNNSRTA